MDNFRVGRNVGQLSNDAYPVSCPFPPNSFQTPPKLRVDWPDMKASEDDQTSVELCTE